MEDYMINMKRKFTEKLIHWKENNISQPLMVIGARQTGKTYVLRKFCEDSFENNIYINFEEQREYIQFFEESLNPEEIIRKIEVFRSEKIDIEKTVIFFDEIQACEKAVTALKYFNESKKNYKVICAGSLLGVAINRHGSSFPVGKVYVEKMFPMDFEEFLLASGEEMLAEEISRSYQHLKRMSEPLHKKAIDLYRQYLCVGGMPAAVIEYVKKGKDLTLFDRNVHSNIIFSYLADMSKYTSGTQAVKTNQVYNSIPAQLAKENKKFAYKLVDERAKKESYETAIEWLMSSGLLLKSMKIELPQVPMTAYQKPNYFKLFLSDVGLLTYLSKLNFSEILLETTMIYRGILTENFVAQNFANKGIDLFYWESKSMAEIDFLLNIEGDIIPVEVKSSENTKSKSLKTFNEKYNPSYSMRISTKNFGLNEKIRSIPLYAVHLLK
ncbi:MAG: AAA family ATPase [bacterium]|jgi:predicted AAA+ superfamily ATPase|nr:AAA family ATPase [bacterium]